MVDKHWGDKPPLATKASKKLQPLQGLVMFFYVTWKMCIIYEYASFIEFNIFWDD